MLVDDSLDGETVKLHVGETTLTLTRVDAHQIRAALRRELPDRREFVRTAGTHRPDGRYVVERRRATSGGHRKVFDSFDDLVGLFRSLPDSMRVDDIVTKGLSGSRRHVVLWHFVEHPAFECSLRSKQPLTVEKRVDRKADTARSVDDS
ncbi:DUF7528 family protein [Halovivax gelatinilyticus]|uniref:DUF7528 family protein n=1 Tax=Halovivax gelatinilyticus TaxID=2961597 RepID=UPI0020CA94F8|nr:hypothetical protein [Halovivax gelatinilyticus]